MKLLTLLITLLLSASVLSQEDKITVSGFWAGMSASEFASNCIARKYYCFDDSFQAINRPPNGDDAEVIDTQMITYLAADVETSKVFVAIPCGITNTCYMSLSEVADLLDSENIVSSCDPTGDRPVCFKGELENGKLEVVSISTTGNYPSILISSFLTPNFN